MPDTTPGKDRWQYRYFVSDYTFKANHGFTIHFDHTLYKKIEDPPPVNGDWEAIVGKKEISIEISFPHFLHIQNRSTN
ncbi:hypothetical protein HYR99_11340 [Candidatus Poribacteria bacterium]|nr:hypothetical protein [Candidatus Poribacteria bacterium]